MECCRRPNRSDAHLSVEEEAKLEEKTRQYFDDKAPKRHTKPQRSDYSSNYVDVNTSDDSTIIPEYVEFQRLEKDPHEQKIVCNGNEARDEFVETEYYKDLNCVDKQHHTTGTGFIRMDSANGRNFSLKPDLDTSLHAACKGNPATNDWIPAALDAVYLASDKPNRSEN
ncbi:hypothetical protein COLO4_19086 [Corchorus olitorius]|uniref:Maternal effect embryo arrest 59 n=1 Tax=Corchorus olitorius TaxID=93759 RepID=A0A1R3J6N3_9ROSI|nr:hypothetical protein COLO4_19086 [Corchorus olitorius]